ncbi:hypothetical protein PFICI_09582 [Pestalotiopsis fici W106-1]|uniref:Major facilitator superfamily (MFS) profile domain-containing protein n=1 Tax=Pestalotiopsis fici (strain W106-1 / CGMCC3.15140) TaxID=1229662 RepID=W3X154_PESFW|nr:uncharacterized protein PFICI_09582 [Pestalotiopsis fici W106-1]ETS79729.1 hypothetical protein PFICI_09582 [Pestalotiopsis fici W106-1]
MQPSSKNECDHIESAKVIASSSQPLSSDAEKERRLVRKLDRTILVWIMILYLLSYLDRSNIGNARNIGLATDLHLNSSMYQLASASFYIGTFLFGTIGGLMLKVIKPSTWLGLCAIGWGSPFASSWEFFEASFAPGCALYLSFWYLKSELSLRIAAYAGMSAASGVISGLIAYGVGNAGFHKPAAWQVLFMVEGLPTIVFGLLTFWVPPGRPEMGKSHWFTDEEHLIILSRRTRFTKNSDDGINWVQIRGAFKDYRLYLFVFIYSGLSLSLAVSAVFLPTIVGTLGYKSVEANLMTAPVYGVAYFVLLVTAWLSDRFRMRGPFIALGGLIAGIGYILLGTLSDQKSRYGVCILAIAGTYMAFPLTLAWISSTFAGDSKAGTGIGVVIAVTHAVGVAASTIYPAEDAPHYLMGNAVSGALTLTTAVAAILMSFLLFRENRSRDKKYGRPEIGIPIDMGGDADMARDYRYEL